MYTMFHACLSSTDSCDILSFVYSLQFPEFRGCLCVFYIYSFILKVVEVSSSGMVSTRKISRRHLLKSSGKRNVLSILLSAGYGAYFCYSAEENLVCYLLLCIQLSTVS